MICKHCGNEIRDDARFCPHCGTANTPGLGSELPQGAVPYGAPATPVWEGPEGGEKKKKTGLFIGIGAAVVAVIVLAAVLAGGLFSNPKKQVEAAFVKSAADYIRAEKALNMPDISQWQKDKNVSQRISLELKDINSALIGYDLSSLSGLGLGMRTDYSGKDRFMDFELLACWGDDELLDLRMAADDDLLYFNSPQLTGETYYGLNTRTMGDDIAEMTGDDSVKDMSFNLFDLVDTVLEKIDQEAMARDLEEARKELWDAAQVKKSGAMTLDLNGTQAKTTAYRVTIPQEALENYADKLADILSATDYCVLYEEIYQSMGMPQDQIDEIMSALKAFDIYGELAGSLKDAADKIGDLELDVCLSGGYVSAVLYEDRVSGSDVKVSVYLGGGEEYVDDLSLEVEIDGVKLTVESTGDHGGRSGVFTDKTTIKGDPLKTSLSLSSITSELRYEPKKAADNLTWVLSIPGAGSLDMSGSLTAEANYVSLSLEDVSLKVMGMNVCTLGFDYVVDCLPSEMPVQDPKIITRMNELELMQMVLDTQKRVISWSSEMEELFASRLPAELLYGILY